MKEGEGFGLVIVADDVLKIRAQKTSAKGKLKFRQGWWRLMDHVKDASGFPEVTNYFKKVGEKYENLSVRDWEKLSDEERREWKAAYRYKLEVDNWTWFEVQNNMMTLNLRGLSTLNVERLVASRYRMAVDAVREILGDVIAFVRRGAQDAERSHLEAARNKVKRLFVLSEYEVNFFVRGELAERLYEWFKQTGWRRDESDNAVYLGGGKGKRYGAKMYGMFERSGDVNLKGMYKVEIKLEREDLRKVDKQVAAFKSQEEIVELLKGLLFERIKKLHDMKKNGVMREFQVEAIKAVQEGNVLARLARVERVQEDIKTVQEDILARLARLETAKEVNDVLRSMQEWERGNWLRDVE